MQKSNQTCINPQICNLWIGIILTIVLASIAFAILPQKNPTSIVNSSYKSASQKVCEKFRYPIFNLVD